MVRLSNRWKVLTACYALFSMVVVAIACLAVIFDVASPFFTGKSYSGDLLDIPYYADKPWARQFLEDEEAIASAMVRYEPFTVWRHPPYQSSTVNVDASRRRVVPATSQAPDALQVFFFGGSTMWGTSSPDWATLPNQVVELFQGRSTRPLHAVNFGESAWVSTQSLIALQQALQRGERPEVVVFYEGANDLLMGFVNNSPFEHGEYVRVASVFNSNGRGRGSRMVWFPRPGSLARGLMPNTFFRFDRSQQYARAPVGGSEEQLQQLAEQVAQVYRTNQETVRALGRRYQFETRFYWQPHSAYGKKPLNEAEEAIIAQRTPNPQWLRSFRRFASLVHAAVTEMPSEDSRDLSNVFAEQTQQIYTDPSHVTPEGNRLIAEAMVEDLARNCAAFQISPGEVKVPNAETSPLGGEEAGGEVDAEAKPE